VRSGLLDPGLCGDVDIELVPLRVLQGWVEYEWLLEVHIGVVVD
jgi:hypothetical protein